MISGDPSLVVFQDRFDLGQQVGGLELLSDGAFGGDADEAELSSALVPVNDLLDAGLLYVVWQGGLVADGSGAREDEAAGVDDAAELSGGAERLGEFDD